LNLNDATIVKQDIDNLIIAWFIQPIEEVTWLSPIAVVPKKNGKLRIWVNFKKLNEGNQKKSLSLPFSDEVLNTTTGYEAYSFLDGYSWYH
jgi:hypothetical protein